MLILQAAPPLLIQTPAATQPIYHQPQPSPLLNFLPQYQPQSHETNQLISPLTTSHHALTLYRPRNPSTPTSGYSVNIRHPPTIRTTRTMTPFQLTNEDGTLNAEGLLENVIKSVYSPSSSSYFFNKPASYPQLPTTQAQQLQLFQNPRSYNINYRGNSGSGDIGDDGEDGNGGDVPGYGTFAK